MSWSFSIGTVKGTVIRLHVTFLLFLLWIAAMSYAQAGIAAAVWGLVFFALLFLCVVLHEFGHILTARHFGVRTPEQAGAIARVADGVVVGSALVELCDEPDAPEHLKRLTASLAEAVHAARKETA